MVNRGEERVIVHMNVVPRSTRNTNNGIVGSSPTEVKRFFFFASCGSLFPLLGLTPSGLFIGLSST